MSSSSRAERRSVHESKGMGLVALCLLTLACGVTCSSPRAALGNETLGGFLAEQENASGKTESEQLAKLEEAISELGEPPRDSMSIARCRNEALRLFNEGRQPVTRQRSYELLKRFAPRELPDLVRTVRIRVPNVSCYGRFLDALNERVRDPSPWIHEITIVNTDATRLTRELAEFPLGTDAELSVVVDAARSERELADWLVKAYGPGVATWRIEVAMPIERLLNQAAALPEDASAIPNDASSDIR